MGPYLLSRVCSQESKKHLLRSCNDPDHQYTNLVNSPTSSNLAVNQLQIIKYINIQIYNYCISLHICLSNRYYIDYKNINRKYTLPLLFFLSVFFFSGAHETPALRPPMTPWWPAAMHEHKAAPRAHRISVVVGVVVGGRSQ